MKNLYIIKNHHRFTDIYTGQMFFLKGVLTQLYGSQAWVKSTTPKVLLFKVFKGLVSVRLLKVLKVLKGLKVLKVLKLLKVLKGMEHSRMSVSRYVPYFFFGVRKLSGCKVI